jgi:hypothetical protein
MEAWLWVGNDSRQKPMLDIMTGMAGIGLVGATLFEKPVLSRIACPRHMRTRFF